MLPIGWLEGARCRDLSELSVAAGEIRSAGGFSLRTLLEPGPQAVLTLRGSGLWPDSYSSFPPVIYYFFGTKLPNP